MKPEPRTGRPRGYPAKPKTQRRLRPATAAFSVITAVLYAAAVVWPLVIGARTWVWVDVIVFPFIALIAYAVILGDRTNDGSLPNSPFG
ncbi:hypothetical protein ACFYRN_41595 [Streptomyces sp. NPDC005227]|uniref:hypothetical protein n=1 Tax=unclassified Streptomyces TaxID=2593676 RepID=UPI003696BBCD